MPLSAPASEDFCIHDAVVSGALCEAKFGHLDLGPTDALCAEQLSAAYNDFFGISPLSSPVSSRASSAALDLSNDQPPDAHTQPQGNSNARKRRRKSRARRAERRREENQKKPRYGERDDVQRAHVAGAPSTSTAYSVADAPFASTGFIANPGPGGSPRTVAHLIDTLGFQYVEAPGNKPRAITDTAGRVIAVYAGAPDDPSWAGLCLDAFDALQDGASRCRFTAKMKKHRRGNFPALNAGVSFGGGQQEPGNLTQSCAAHTHVVEDLVSHAAFARIAGFASSVFKTWAPKLHAYYGTKLDKLLAWKPSLRRLFPGSVWAAAAFNLGPRTVSSKHKDFANIPFGLCAVTALGRFDYRKGGHMVLWELRLVLEFPPGTTILLTSAVVSHSNTPIQPGEVRCSFAQYTAGGLVRWVDHGLQPDESYFKAMSKEDLERVGQDNAERIKYGISLFSTLDELRKTKD